MKTNKILTCLLAFIALTFACSEKDLDVQSTRQLASSYYKFDDQVKNGLMAAYNPSENTGDATGWGTSLVIWGSVASDDAHSGGGGSTDQSGYQGSDTYTCSPSDPGNDLINFWSNYFQGINRCNLLISNVTPDDDYKKSAVAEAQFLCAFYYFYLSRVFGGLPLMSKVPSSKDIVKRSSLDSTYAFVENLLIEAINSGNLPDRTNGVDPEEGIATIASAQALLGKVYMYHAAFIDETGTRVDNPKYYTSAIKYLSAVVNNTNYALDAFWHIFSPGNRHGIESIFEINFSQVSGVFGNADSRLCGIRTVNTRRINDTLDYGWGFNQPSLNLVNAFKAQNDLIRLNATAFNADTVRKWHKKYATDSLQYQNLYEGYWDAKHYVDNRFETGNWRTASNPQIVLRLGDIYLLLAEAYFQTGDVTNAALYVNKVRHRAHLADLGSVTLQDIKNERRLETALEGDRYFDLVRWGDAANTLDTLGFQDGTPGVKTNALFPIPQQEINRTTGASALIQNPGY